MPLESQEPKSARRLVIPVKNQDGLMSLVFDRFGHSPYFAVVDVDDEGQLKGGVTVTPCGDKHKPGAVPRFVRDVGAHAVLARNIGEKAHRALEKGRVDCRQARAGTVFEVVMEWFSGQAPALAPHSQHDEDHQGGSHTAHEGSGAHGCGCHTDGEGQCGGHHEHSQRPGGCGSGACGKH